MRHITWWFSALFAFALLPLTGLLGVGMSTTHEGSENGRWPWTAARLATGSDLSHLLGSELELMRNEIYARHGWVFSRKDLQDYFAKQPWYRAKGTAADRDVVDAQIAKELGDIERRNIAMIDKAESLTRITATSSVKEMLKLGAVPATGRGDWWMSYHDRQHTGRSPFTGPRKPFKQWAFDTRNTVLTSPAISADGTIYVGSSNHGFYALHRDGTKKWAIDTGASVDSSPAIGVDGTIYVVFNSSKLCALNPDGAMKWTCVLDCGCSSPVIAADGTIYIGDHANTLYAIQPDGKKKWTFSLANCGDTIPAIGTDGTIYVGSQELDLYAINPNGTKKWVFPTGASTYSSPAIGADGTIYAGSCDGNFYAINPDGSQKWTIPIDDLSYSATNAAVNGAEGANRAHAKRIKVSFNTSPAIGADGTIYVVPTDGRLYAFSPKGKKKWVFDYDIRLDSCPAIGADGSLYFGTEDGIFHALNADGTRKWTFTCDTLTPVGEEDGADDPCTIFYPPALGADGTIYVGSSAGLYAIGEVGKGITKKN